MLAYLVTNKANQKAYVGITTRSLERRWYEHCFEAKSCGKLLSKAIKKYGKDSFEIQPIASSLGGVDDLKQIERVLIEQHNTLVPNGYNLTKGGDGVWGFKHSPESVERMAARNRGRTHSDETKKRMSEVRAGENNHFFGRTHSEETKAKISATKQGCSGPWAGKSRDEDTRRKISLALTGRPGHKHTEESRRKIAMARLGKKQTSPSEETRKKLSESIKASWIARRQKAEKGV